MFIPLFVTANKEYETTMGLFRIYVFVSAIICFFFLSLCPIKQSIKQ